LPHEEERGAAVFGDGENERTVGDEPWGKIRGSGDEINYRHSRRFRAALIDFDFGFLSHIAHESIAS